MKKIPEAIFTAFPSREQGRLIVDLEKKYRFPNEVWERLAKLIELANDNDLNLLVGKFIICMLNQGEQFPTDKELLKIQKQVDRHFGPIDLDEMADQRFARWRKLLRIEAVLD